MLNRGPGVAPAAGSVMTNEFHKSSLPAFNALNRKENYQQKLMVVEGPGREYKMPGLSVSQLEF